VSTLDRVVLFDDAASMPEGWTAVTLDTVAQNGGTFCDGDWVESKDQDPNGDVRLIQLADVGVGEFRDRSERFLTSAKAAQLSCTFLERGDILIARMPEPLGRACIFPGDKRRAVTVVDVAIVRPANPKVNSRWLMHRVNAPDFRRAVSSLQKGSTRQRISRKNLATICFALPSVDDQDVALAEIEKQFSRLDEAVAGLQRVKANLKRYKAAVLKAAVEGRLVPTEADLARREGRNYETGAQLLHRILEARRSHWQGKGKYKEPAGPDTTDLPELPAGWAWATAEQLVDFITKGTTPEADKLSEGSGDVQFLKVYNLTFDGVLNYRHKPAFVSREVHENELSRSKVRAGDVLINIVGPPLGQVSVVPEFLQEANINQAIARFRPIDPLGSPFLAVLLMSKEVMRWAISRAKTTSGQSNLTLELCRALPIPIPPLAEQHRIVAEVDRLLSIACEAEAEVDANLKRAQSLRQAILGKAFSA